MFNLCRLSTREHDSNTHWIRFYPERQNSKMVITRMFSSLFWKYKNRPRIRTADWSDKTIRSRWSLVLAVLITRVNNTRTFCAMCKFSKCRDSYSRITYSRVRWSDCALFGFISIWAGVITSHTHSSQFRTDKAHNGQIRAVGGDEFPPSENEISTAVKVNTSITSKPLNPSILNTCSFEFPFCKLKMNQVARITSDRFWGKKLPLEKNDNDPEGDTSGG